MTLNQWLKKIEGLHPREIDLGLDRVRAVYDRMPLQRPDIPIFTITGTNGKGSTVRLLESILIAQGFKVGCYTSPHLLTYNERVRIQEKNLEDDRWIEAFEAVESALKDVTLTYFEFGTLAALYLLFKADLEAIILEVGMGGRLDAVNLIDADVAILTSVGLDHQEWLGETRAEIAREKAGIFRPGRPAVIGEAHLPEGFMHYCDFHDFETYAIGKDFHIEIIGETWSWCDAETTIHDLPDVALGKDNAACVLMALKTQAQRIPVTLAAIQEGLHADLLGRCTPIMTERVPVYLDVGHNPAAAACLLQRLERYQVTGKTHFVIGMLSDKDIAGTLAVLLPVADHFYFASLMESPRGAQAYELENKLRGIGTVPCESFETVRAAYEFALKTAAGSDRIVVMGSFVTIAAILS